MISTLTPVEKQEMFKHSDLLIANEFLSDDPLDPCKVLSIINKEKPSEMSYKILKFMQVIFNETLSVNNLEKVKSDISSLTDVYIAVCEGAVDMLIKNARDSNLKRVAIHTRDPFIKEILLEKKFSLSRYDLNGMAVSGVYTL